MSSWVRWLLFFKWIQQKDKLAKTRDQLQHQFRQNHFPFRLILSSLEEKCLSYLLLLRFHCQILSFCEKNIESDDDNAKPNKSNGGDYDWDYYSVGNGSHYLYCNLIAYNALRAWLNPDCSSTTFSCSLLNVIAHCLFPVLHKKQVIIMSGTITQTLASSLWVSAAPHRRWSQHWLLHVSVH